MNIWYNKTWDVFDKNWGCWNILLENDKGWTWIWTVWELNYNMNAI